jgi:hypothetical protein
MAVPTWTTGQVLTASDVNTWFAPISAVKTATESVTSSTTLQNDDELVIAVAANSVYWLEAVIYYDAGTVGDIKMTFTGPASATCAINIEGISTAATGGGDFAKGTLVAFGTPMSFGGTGAASDRTLHCAGVINIAGTAGNVRLQWAQDASSAGATRVFANSAMWARRIS